MKEIFAQRLKSARLLKQLSLRELAEAVNGKLSHTAIANYEKGELIPDSQVLNILSNALDVKTDYFFRPFSVKLEKVEFRKHSRLQKKQVEGIREHVLETLERYLELEQFLQITSIFRNPLEDRIIRSGEDVEEAANALRNSWQLGKSALPNVIELLEDKGVKVAELKEVSDDFDGLSSWVDEQIPVLIVNSNFSVERKRFTVLHELGHLLLNFSSELEHKQIEKFCHRFAGAVLMPRETVLQELGSSRSQIAIGELIVIKEQYGMSIRALMARAADLNIINRATYRYFCIRVNQNPLLKKEIGFGSYTGIERSNRFRQLLYRATAEEIISMSKAASLNNMRLAEFRDEYLSI